MRRRLLGKLQRQLDSCKHKYTTVEDISAYLRSIDDEYARMKPQQFTRMVRQTLESSPNQKGKNPQNPNKFQNQPRIQTLSPQPVRLLDIHSDAEEEEEELNRVNSSRKKLKKLDESEERLKRIENMHVRKRRNQNTRKDSDDSSESSDESENGDGEEGTVSTSEDAIYEEKVEPAFDITKLGLRKMYTEANSMKSSAKLKKEKNIELEMNTDKQKRKIEVGIGSESKGEGKNLSSGLGSGLSDSVFVKGKEGPRFRDLGGMKEVLEELKMEVIVPLYHPELPRTLGVRPMAGILLHGPPGCGKTKLAHAIANETNVPFYQISATEIVSGVSGIQCRVVLSVGELMSIGFEGSFSECLVFDF